MRNLPKSVIVLIALVAIAIDYLLIAWYKVSYLWWTLVGAVMFWVFCIVLGFTAGVFSIIFEYYWNTL